MNWISVKKRLPRPDETDIYSRVMVFYKLHDKGEVRKIVDVAEYAMNTFIVFPDNEGVEITHWMPLPELPKEVQNGKTNKTSEI